MKKDSKKDLLISRALDALKKQALRDEEIKQLKGGAEESEAHVDGMWWWPF